MVDIHQWPARKANPLPVVPRNDLQTRIGPQIGPHSEALTPHTCYEEPVRKRRLVDYLRGALTERTGNGGRRRVVAHWTTLRFAPKPNKASK